MTYLASEQTPSEAGCWADATPELNSRWVTEAEQSGDNFLRAWVCPQKPECPFVWAVVVSKIAVQQGTEWIPWMLMAPDLSLGRISITHHQRPGAFTAVRLCASSLTSLNASLLTLEI